MSPEVQTNVTAFLSSLVILTIVHHAKRAWRRRRVRREISIR